MAQGQKQHRPCALGGLKGTPKARASRGSGVCSPGKISKILDDRIALVAISRL